MWTPRLHPLSTSPGFWSLRPCHKLQTLPAIRPPAIGSAPQMEVGSLPVSAINIVIAPTRLICFSFAHGPSGCLKSTSCMSTNPAFSRYACNVDGVGKGRPIFSIASQQRSQCRLIPACNVLSSECSMPPNSASSQYPPGLVHRNTSDIYFPQSPIDCARFRECT